MNMHLNFVTALNKFRRDMHVAYKTRIKTDATRDRAQQAERIFASFPTNFHIVHQVARTYKTKGNCIAVHRE